MPRGKSWLMATVALKFFLLSLHTSSLPRWGGLRVRNIQRRCFLWSIMVHMNFKKLFFLFCKNLFFCNFIIQTTSNEIAGNKNKMLTFHALLWCILPKKLCWAQELWAIAFWQAGHRKTPVSNIFTILRTALLSVLDKARGPNSFSPQNYVHWCCLLYSGSPWWLCSSRCPPHLGALAVCETPTPGRLLNRSQPRSFQPSPVQKNKKT